MLLIKQTTRFFRMISGGGEIVRSGSIVSLVSFMARLRQSLGCKFVYPANQTAN